MGCSTSKTAEESRLEHKFYSQYKLGKKLGEGAFGQVRSVVDRKTQKELAVKIVDVRERDSSGACKGGVNKSRDRVTKLEVELWSLACNTTCPYVVELLETFSEKALYYMVCEKCECSFMDQLVTADAENMTESDLKGVFRQMLEGIAHTHALGIVHRDIKLDNFLWGHDGVLKLCDYGLAARMPSNGTKLSGVFGTAPYMAPEMLKSEGYDYLVDIWSTGALAYLLVYGSFPYTPSEASASAMKQAIVNNAPPLQFGGESMCQGVVSGRVAGALDFTKELLMRDVAERPSAAVALKLPFLLEETKEVVAEPLPQEELPDATLIRKRRSKVRTLTQKLKNKPDATVQNGIDDLLKRILSKSGLDDASGSNIFFSEGDKDMGDEVETKVSEADSRIQKASSRRDVRHTTHSGVLEVKSNASGPKTTSFALDLASPASTLNSRDLDGGRV